MDYDGLCINCARFHRGQCNKDARTCWICGGSGHIRRFCPSKLKYWAPRCELRPGTSSWCAALGLDEDPLLKSNIMTTLKQYPGATIYLNDECIYRGVQTYFYRKSLPQRPDLAERLRRPARVSRLRSRSRSRSPSRKRVLKRSRSPFRRYSRANSTELVEDGERDVGNLTSQNINLYARHSLSPMIDLIDVEMASPAHFIQAENIPPIITSVAGAGKCRLTPIPGATPSTPLSASRSALGLLSGNIPYSSSLDSPINGNAASQIATGALVQMEDPHFVLGISKGARDAEIISAYQQRMWEIELERSSEGLAVHGDEAAVNRWEESIRILTSAKTQLLGGSLEKTLRSNR